MPRCFLAVIFISVLCVALLSQTLWLGQPQELVRAAAVTTIPWAVAILGGSQRIVPRGASVPLSAKCFETTKSDGSTTTTTHTANVTWWQNDGGSLIYLANGLNFDYPAKSIGSKTIRVVCVPDPIGDPTAEVTDQVSLRVTNDTIPLLQIADSSWSRMNTYNPQRRLIIHCLTLPPPPPTPLNTTYYWWHIHGVDTNATDLLMPLIIEPHELPTSGFKVSCRASYGSKNTEKYGKAELTIEVYHNLTI